MPPRAPLFVFLTLVGGVGLFFAASVSRLAVERSAAGTLTFEEVRILGTTRTPARAVHLLDTGEHCALRVEGPEGQTTEHTRRRNRRADDPCQAMRLLFEQAQPVLTGGAVGHAVLWEAPWRILGPGGALLALLVGGGRFALRR